MTGEAAVRRMAAAAVLLVAAIAAVISYVHIERLAVTHGQTALAAYLLPLSIDGTVAAASLAMLRAARSAMGTPRLARFMLGLAVTATLGCNVAYGARFGVTGSLLSGWPAVAFIGSAELAIGMARRARAGSQDPARAPAPVPVRTDVPAPAGALPAPVPVRTDVPAPAGALPAPVHTPVPVPGRSVPVPVPVPALSAPVPVPASADVPAVPAHGHGLNGHAHAAAELFAAELAAGDIPTIRRIRADMRVGGPRAKEIQQHLTTLTPAGQSIARARAGMRQHADEMRQGVPEPSDPASGAVGVTAGQPPHVKAADN